ncbi:MAG: cofactor-independent phosphoglycerate mutase [Eubacteriales bacterium]|nr:cofactor-independent phosphoglycerate mutase [Eubacteriales bacterium]
MKHLVVLIDGAADDPIDSLGGKTPLEAAHKPYMDMLAQKGECRLLETVPSHLSPGSDIANLAIMGYDPDKYYSGRSPLEGVSMGVEILDTDTTFRTNVVTLSDDTEYENKTMIDYSAGEITTAESTQLIKYLDEKLGCKLYRLFPGVSYRHLLLWHDMLPDIRFTPPHDISGKKITEYLPGDDMLLDLMKKSYELLSDHPINKDRISRGLNPANSVWFWGQGTKPLLPNFKEKYGKNGSMISAVDLLKGIAICAGMKSIDVEGATGTIDTNFEGKTEAAILEFKDGQDFVYIHLEAPDECGHHFDTEGKVKSLEFIDEKVVGPLYEYLKGCGDDFSILVTPDHATPIVKGTHTHDKIPYIIYRSNQPIEGVPSYCEKCATGNADFAGYKIMDYFINGKA